MNLFLKQHRPTEKRARFSNKITRWTILLAVAVCILPCSYHANQSPQNDGKEIRKWALLIGIDQYRENSISNLNGCVNDIERMQQILIHRFGFDSTRVKLLKDDEATIHNIRQSVKTHLLNNKAISEDDVVVIYYSGHGYQQEDKNEDEPDGWDETIVPHDALPGETDITDDEIEVWVRQLRQKTANLVIIFDSCHSGSATRDPYSVVRRAYPEEKDQRGTRGLDTPVDGRGIRASDWIAVEPGYVLISGCRHYESSHEFTSDEGERRGVLSYYLQNALLTMKTALTYQELTDEVRAQMKGTRYSHKQHPVVEGDLDKLVFSGLTVERRPYFQVTAIREDSVEIDAGSLHLMSKGSIIGAYPKDTRAFKDEKNCLAYLKVEKVSSISSTAVIVSGVKGMKPCQGSGKITRESKVVELRHNFGELSLPVYIAGIKDPSVREKITAIKKSLPFVEFTIEDSAEVFFSAAGDTLKGPLVDPYCLQKRDPHSESYTAQVESEFLRLIQRKNLSLLGTPPMSRFHITGDIIQVNWDEGQRKIVNKDTLQPPAGDDRLILKVGDRFKVRITNHSSTPVWIAVLDIKTDGGVSVIYPIQGARDNRVAPQQSFEFPPGTGRYVVEEPLGTEELMIVGTAEWRSFQSVEIPGCTSGKTRGDVKAPESPLEALFARPYLETRVGVEMGVVEDWATTVISFEVVTSSE